ncbi:MAG TPA: sel1 repeat family protein [Bacteroidetes bacterium]|nr:sel1 repeat family protein [Bacteroidota bacterium]
MRSMFFILLVVGTSLLAHGQIRTIRAQAYSGDAAACLKYSKAFFKGRLVEQDLDSAAIFLSRAKAGAKVEVWKSIAKAYAYGLGVEKSQDSAFVYLQFAANADDTEALLDLSEAYRFGHGVSKSDDLANHYLNVVAEKGEPDAQFLVGTIFVQSAFDAKKYSKGLKLLRQAAEKGHPQANFQLCGIFSERNTGTESDKYYSLVKAYAYSYAASQLGVPKALYYCAEARLKGRGTTQNDSLALVFMTQAADSFNYLPARNRMGNLYWDGTVTGQQEALLALQYYQSVKQSRISNVDQRAKAELGIHEVDQFLKQVQNYMLRAGGWIPVTAFDYRIRE